MALEVDSIPLLEERDADGVLDGGLTMAPESRVRSASFSGVPPARCVTSATVPWQRGQTSPTAFSGVAHSGQVGTGEL
jgi:hypothetical protein